MYWIELAFDSRAIPQKTQKMWENSLELPNEMGMELSVRWVGSKSRRFSKELIRMSQLPLSLLCLEAVFLSIERIG